MRRMILWSSHEAFGYQGAEGAACTTYQVDAPRSTILMQTSFHDSIIAYRYCLRSLLIRHGAGLKDCRPLYHTSTLHRKSKPTVPAFVLSLWKRLTNEMSDKNAEIEDRGTENRGTNSTGNLCTCTVSRRIRTIFNMSFFANYEVIGWQY